MFDTKFAIVLRNDLEIWQKLNVTAFLAGGIIGQKPDLIGEAYRDAAGHVYNALPIQPAIVLAADGDTIRTIHRRALDRGLCRGDVRNRPRRRQPGGFRAVRPRRREARRSGAPR